MQASLPQPGFIDEGLIAEFEFVRQLVMSVRGVRSEKNIPPKEQIPVFIRSEKSTGKTAHFDDVIIKLCNLSELQYSPDQPADSVSFIVGTTECFIPLVQNINVEDEIKKLEEELSYQQGFLVTVMKKLDNAGFVNNAPAKVVDAEKKKQADTEARISVLSEQLISLRK